MPQGKDTYGNQVGRPKKTATKTATKVKKKAIATKKPKRAGKSKRA